MKKLAIALPFGLMLGLAGQAAFANTGVLNFSGKINGNTCQVDVVNPGSGAVGSQLSLGEVAVSNFTKKGDEAGGAAFQLRVTGGTSCVTAGKNATVTFTSVQGAPAGDATLYGIKALPGAATGLGIVLKDNQGTAIAQGVASKAHALNDQPTPTLLYFTALYKAAAANVTAGPVEADINFTVAIN